MSNDGIGRQATVAPRMKASTSTGVNSTVKAFTNLVARSSNQNFMVDPCLGIVLEDRYEINELIGTGAWGNVYKATDYKLGTIVAVKIVHRHLLKDEDNIKRFRREARLLSCFDSNNVIRVIDANTDPFPYIVMDYFDGIPLNQWLKENGPMNPQMAMDLFNQLCQCLSEAELFNIVHRDLKPGNILIKTYGNVIEARIVDFGLGKCIDQTATCGSRITSSGEILGSPPYMAPEQFKGQSDNRSDLYSLGCVIYEALAGRQAFTAQYSLDYLQQHFSKTPQRISEVNPEAKLPRGLEEIVFKCLQKTPEKRYQSGKMCRQDLKSVKEGLKPKYVQGDGNGKQGFSFEKIFCGSAIFVILLAAALQMGHPTDSFKIGSSIAQTNTKM